MARFPQRVSQMFVASAVRCAPTHSPSADCAYRVAWKLNPHMVVGGVDPVRAEAQHATLVRTVRALGAEVVELPFVHGAFDSVFAKDSAIYTRSGGTIFVAMATPRHLERRREQPARAGDVARRFGKQAVSTSVAPFEGGDVIVLGDGTMLLGHGFRSTTDAARLLEAHFGTRVIPLELRDPHLYHLDTALAVLADGTALVCEEAFTRAALASLAGVATRWVSVPRSEAVAFALNIVEIGDSIVTGTESLLVRRELESLGKTVIMTPLDEFQRAGGSAACLLAPIYDATAWLTLDRLAG